MEQQHQLALTLWNTGAFEERDRVLKDNVELSYANLGSRNRDYQRALFSLVAALHDGKEYSNLVDLLQAYPVGSVPVSPKYHADYWRSIGKHAHALHSLDRYALAKPVYEKALEGLGEMFGTTSESDYVFYALNYANCLLDLKLYRESIKTFEELEAWKESTTNIEWVEEYEKMWKKATDSLDERKLEATQ